MLDGGEGTDTLKVTLASSDVSDSVAPILSNIETINVRFTGDDDLSLANASGVNTVNVSQSTAANSTTGLGTVGTLNVSNQTVGATFTGSTATALTLGVSDVSKAVTVDLDDAAATSLTLNLDTVGAKSAAGAITNVTLDQDAGTATAVTANLTGDNYVTATNILDAAKTISAAGTGSLTLSGSATLAALETLNVSGGASVDVDAITAGALKTVAAGETTGDVAVKVDATATSVTTGSGDDTVTYTAALAADSSVNLGAGDDVLTVTGNDKTAAVDAGAGTDVLAATSANFSTILGDADKPKSFTNFETLKVTDAMANGSSVDVSKVAGVTNFIAGAGVAAGGSATATGLGADATVEIAGANTAVAAQNAIYTLDFAGAAANDAGDTVTIEGVLAYTAVGADDASTIAAGVRAGNTISIGGVTYDITGSGTQVILTAQTANDTNATFDLLVVDDAAEGGITQPTTTAFAPSQNGIVAAAAGTLNLVAKTDSADDSVNLVLNQNYTENNDATATATAATSTVDASKFETVNVESTGKASATFAGAEGTKADSITNTLALTDNELVTLNVSGDQKLVFSAAAGMTKLATVNASANTAGVTIDVADAVVTAGVAITGTDKADTITGSDLGDTITLGGGNDTVDFTDGKSAIGTGKFDTITDFSANTYGSGTDGKAEDGETAAADTTKWTGDVLKFDVTTPADGAMVDVLTSAADATTFLANNAGSAEDLVAALDSSTGNLYVDISGDGVADFFIQLTGVTTIDEAAFVLV